MTDMTGTAPSRTFRLYLTDPETGAPRVAMTVLLYAIVLGGAYFLLDYLRQNKKQQPTEGQREPNNGGNPYNQDSGTYQDNNGDGTPQKGEVTPVQYAQWVGEYASNLYRINTKSYPWACYGNTDPNERCEWWNKFLQLTESGQKAVAWDYQSKYGTTFRTDVEAVSVCQCINGWTPSTRNQVLQQLYKLGI